MGLGLHVSAHISARDFLTWIQRLFCIIQVHLLPSTPYTLLHSGGVDYNLLYTSNDHYMHQHHVNKCTDNGCIELYPESTLAIVH